MEMLFPHDAPLVRLLRRPLLDVPRTRAYQARLDEAIDRAIPGWNLDAGTIRSDRPLTGREATAPLALAAFAWHSSLSRHRGDPRLLRFFEAGLLRHTASIDADGLMTSFGLNGEFWAHGWDVEGLLYGLVFTWDALDPDRRRRLRDPLLRSARRHAALPDSHFGMGGIGNQRCVWCLGLHLYGQLLGEPDLCAQSDRVWRDLLPKVLDDSGQVIEQYGPCMHYSYTAFSYAWLNLAVRGEAAETDRLLRCLEGFRCRHTESLYPLAGPSSRRYTETLSNTVIDLLPAAEQMAGTDSRPLRFVERALAALPTDPRSGGPRPTGHGAVPLMWAMIMARAEPLPEPAPDRPVTLEWNSSTLHRRPSLVTLLVRNAYQTHFNALDYLPFSGLQTWAFGAEPPILHPTPLAPSTTQGDRLDTARQGVSHNWGLYGAGAMGLDWRFMAPAAEADLPFLVARYDWLWRLLFFTPRSTVILEFGGGGPRRTLWTLNRVAPAEPRVAPGLVRFEGRRGCLHAAQPEPPDLLELPPDDPWTRGVRQLRYACGEKPAAFALSDDAFRFSGPAADSPAPWRFADADGQYEVRLDPDFFQPNPGTIRFDVYHLAARTSARRLTHA